MNENVMSLLDAELEHAGEGTALSPQMLLLEQLRITPEKELKPMEFLFRLFGKPCFPRGELVAITGKAKSGKTFVTSMLMVTCLTPDPASPPSPLSKGRGGMPTAREGSDYQMALKGGRGGMAAAREGGDYRLALRREREEALRVLWYDTEQSDESTQDILKNRIIPMIKTHPQPLPMMEGSGYLQGQNQMDDLFAPLPRREGLGVGLLEVFNVRAVEWKQRRALLKEAVTHCQPDLVIVDGIRDLVNDINDGVLAQEVMEELLHLATQQNCCIVCVLHQNRGSEDHNLRGWIGTELMNKAFEVYACEKLMPQRVFKLEQTLTRKYDIEQTLYFEVDEQGLPRAHPPPLPKGGEIRSEERLPSINREYIVNDEDGSWQFDVMKLFLAAFQGEDELTGGVLREQVMQLSGIVIPFKYNQLLHQALEQKIIEKSQRDGLTVYRPSPF